jgi:hypothetical protein
LESCGGASLLDAIVPSYPHRGNADFIGVIEFDGMIKLRYFYKKDRL